MYQTHPWLAVVLAILATWRVTHLLAREDGPFHFLARVRARLGHGFFGTLMDCFTCISVWIAAPAAYLLSSDLREWTLLWLALSGATCLLERVFEKPVIFQSLPENPKLGNPHELLRPTENRFASNDHAHAKPDELSRRA